LSVLALPPNALQFIEAVKQDSCSLIRMGTWGVSQARFEKWTNQFCGDEEEFFAACLLNQLTWRTSKQFDSSLRSVFRGGLSSVVIKGGHDLSLIDTVTVSKESFIRFVPVISESDPPTKSGPLVLRKAQRLFRIKNKFLCWPWQVHEQVKHGKVKKIVFVDDFLGSGSQFEDFFGKWKFNELEDIETLAYAPVIAHELGIDVLRKNLPNVAIVSSEILSDKQNFFSESVWARLGQGVVTAERARAWYNDFIDSRGIRPRSLSALGVGDLGLTFGFEHATPNNSLSILWYASDSGWEPLLDR